MKSRMNACRAVLLALSVAFGFGWSNPAHAEDNTSQSINYTTNVTVGPFYVGNTGTNNTLLIYGGGKVTNDFASGTREGIVGYQPGANNNKATISDPGSLWYVNNGVVNVGRAASLYGNALIVTNGGTLRIVTNTTAVSGLTVGNGSSSSNNLLTVTGSGSLVVVEDAQLRVGAGSSSAGNQMLVTDGGTVSNASVLFNGTNLAYIGASGAGPGNNVTVGGGAALAQWVMTGSRSKLYVGDGPSSCALTVTTNGVVDVRALATGYGVSVGSRNGAAGTTLTVTNGGKLLTYDLNVGGTFGSTAGATNNVVTVTGPGSRLEAGGVFIVGNGATSISNRLVVSNGGRMTAIGLNIVGSSASFNYLTITGGGSLTNVNQIYIGDAGGASFNEGLVTGPGSLLDASNPSPNGNNSIIVGGNGGASFNTLTISNGAQAVSGLEVYVGGRNSVNGGTGNVIRVTGAGSMLQLKADGTGRLYAGNGPTAQSNHVEILNGALLEGNLLTAGDNNSGVGNANTISNAGGIFQFTRFDPTIAVNSNVLGNAIAINGGTISFRGITNANIKGNWTGTQLTNMTWVAGATNAFRLNNATNNSTAQDYTFRPGLGSTNYARLELLNGAMYQGGTATFGSGGALIVGNGTETITNLALQSGATFSVTLNATNDYSKLVAVGSVALGGSALQVTLGGTPSRNGFEYVIIRKDSTGLIGDRFADGTVIATYGGRQYPLQVNYLGGDGNDVSLIYRTQGTLLTLE